MIQSSISKYCWRKMKVSFPTPLSKIRNDIWSKHVLKIKELQKTAKMAIFLTLDRRIGPKNKTEKMDGNLKPQKCQNFQTYSFSILKIPARANGYTVVENDDLQKETQQNRAVSTLDVIKMRYLALTLTYVREGNTELDNFPARTRKGKNKT